MTAELALCGIVKLQHQAKQTQRISCAAVGNSDEVVTHPCSL